MSTQIHLAKPGDLDRLEPLVAAFHAEMGLDTDEAHRRAALMPLLDGSPHGAVYIAGPRRAPVGYAAVAWGWSIEFGGLDGYLDEFYVRPGVRGRGIGTEMITALCKVLGAAGVTGLSLEVDRADEAVRALYRKLGWVERDRYILMTRHLTKAG